MYIKYDFITPNSVEFREYQINIADSSSKENTLLVLPTGLGKTVVALILMAKKLKNESENDKILFLAPTKPLVMQHAQFLKQFLTIDEESIVVFTGEISPEERKELWSKSKIIVSTPQVIENDLLSKRLDLKDTSFIVFDEAHHAVGKYSYVFISEIYGKQRKNGHVLGMTASPGSDVSKIMDVCENLDINHIEIRTKYDQDVRPYVHEMKISWKEVSLPRDFSYTIQILRKVLSERLKILKNVGAIDSSSVASITKTKLLDAQKRIQGEIRSRVKPPKVLFKAASVQSEALKIHYAIELLQTQGVNALKNYFQRIGKEANSKGGSKSSRAIMADNSILEAVAYVKSLNIEHPKLQELVKIVKNQLDEKPDSRIIVFTHYRDTSSYVVKILENVENARSVRFIGQASRDKDKGLTQKQQAEVIKKFKGGEYNVLIATSVAEEGLDIPSTELVVFYEPIPSEIRNIQRRGRTGRKMTGNVIILITKGTSDEGYYWASKRREKHMRTELEMLRSKLGKKFSEGKSIYEKRIRETSDQKTLMDYQKKDAQVKIIVDNREYRSQVIRNLAVKGVSVEPQQLDVGDYVLSSRIGVERKSVDDFLNSLIDGKLFLQVSRLRDAYSRPVLILEGEGILTKRNISHNAIFGSFVSIVVDFGIPILTTKDSNETADLLHVMAKREQRKDKKSVAIRGEKTSMSTRERQQFVVEGFPNVSSVIAKRLLDHFGSLREIVIASEEELQEVNGVGKRIASEIFELLNVRYVEE